MKPKGFGGLRCSHPGCRQLFFEVEKDLLCYLPKNPTCQNCGSLVHTILSSYSEEDLGKLIIRYWCSKCLEAFDRNLPSIRKYCKGCKTYQHLFLYAFLGIAQLNNSQPEGMRRAA